MDFPLFKTKSPPGSPKFDFNDSRERRAYFDFKAGPEIAKIRQYLDSGRTFLAFMLAKKGAGKGTYAQVFREIFSGEKIVHLSVGDLVRAVDKEVASKSGRKQLELFLKENYRGPLAIGDLVAAQMNRSQKSLLPTEYILALIKREISKLGRQTIFLDGFPRNLDQISYSLFFRDLVGFREDPDFFILIDVPMAVIDQRIRYRVVCPRCQLTKSIRLQPNQFLQYDQKTKDFYALCENRQCPGFAKERMITKEGDEMGIEGIRKRLEMEDELMRKALSLYGLPKILLRNCIPASQAALYVDDYEISSEYEYSWDEKKKKVAVTTKNWLIKDDQGRPSISLLPYPVVVSLIKQLADLL